MTTLSQTAYVYTVLETFRMRLMSKSIFAEFLYYNDKS